MTSNEATHMRLTKNSNLKIIWVIGALILIGMGLGYYLVMNDLDQIKDGFDTYKSADIDDALPEQLNKTVRHRFRQ